MKEKKRLQKGSILVGSILVMLILASITMVVIFRDKEDALMAIDLEAGNLAYTETDGSVESKIRAINVLDNTINDGNIPENTPASLYCDTDSPCNAFMGGSPNFVSEISTISGKQSEKSATRFVQAGLPERVSNLGFTEFNVMSCADDPGKCAGIFGGGTTSWNQCDAKISWRWDTPGETEEEREKNAIENFQVRGSKNDVLTEAGWFAAGAVAGTTDNTYSLSVPNRVNRFQDQANGEKYYYAVKAKNKNMLMLDSLYSTLTTEVGDKNYLHVIANQGNGCDSAQGALGGLNGGIGCIDPALKPLGTRMFNNSYTCCGGTQCYMPDPDWVANDDDDCSLQQCTASAVAAADSTVGGGLNCYGGASSACTAGTEGTSCGGGTCSSCYATLSYCTSLPAASSPNTSIFANTNWAYSTSVNVYMDTSGAHQNMKPRSTFHRCPTAITGISSSCGVVSNGAYSSNDFNCTPQSRGEYSADVTCPLNCAQYYHISGSSVDADGGGGITVHYPNGKTCAINTCSSRPANTSYYAGANVTNIINDNQTAVYSASDSIAKCEYYCNANYHWNGSSCVANACAVKPGGTTTIWWAGDTSSVPTQSQTPVYSAVNTLTKCEYRCAAGFTWNGSACI